MPSQPLVAPPEEGEEIPRREWRDQVNYGDVNVKPRGRGGGEGLKIFHLHRISPAQAEQSGTFYGSNGSI